MLRTWGVEHPTLGLEEGALTMLSFGVDSCFTMDVGEFGGVGRARVEPLLLEWSLGSTHVSLTMNLLRFLQVLSDALPWLPKSSFGWWDDEDN